MITVTDEAQQKVLEFIKQTTEPCQGLRIRARKLGHHTFAYDLTLVLESEDTGGDVVTELEHIKVFVDPQSAEYLEGTTIEFVTDERGSGFKIDNPQAKVRWDDPISQKVQDVLDEKVAPALASHGGWVELVQVDGDTAVVQLGGGCQGCGMAQVTLTDGIQKAILDAVPEIKRVADATDHAGGENPYFTG
ncbi:MAG: iron-sulfur cluster assembly accessory protein [Acidobacteria bacterium]|nr:iron-sulfur cluster assembly accessory protein [Acidobacteriota bacterium]